MEFVELHFLFVVSYAKTDIGIMALLDRLQYIVYSIEYDAQAWYKHPLVQLST